MQLTIEVLPAPFGPMIEDSSPSFTPKETSVSARTPPKRSDTPRTSNVYDTHSLRTWRLSWRSLSSVSVATMTLHRGPNSGHPTMEAGLGPPSCVVTSHPAVAIGSIRPGGPP